MLQLNQLFFGSLIKEHREYLAKVIPKIKPEKVTIPAVGMFNFANVCISAGIPPEKIYTSDISLFSSVLGYLFDPEKSLLDLPIKDEVKVELKKLTSEIERAAYLLLLIKTQQLDPSKYYMEIILDDIIIRWAEHHKKLSQRLEKYASKYAGLHYEIRDMWEVMNNDAGLILVCPPVYSGGYERQFKKAEQLVGYVEPTPQFIHKELFRSLVERATELSIPVFISSYDVEKCLPPENLLCAVEKKQYLIEAIGINDVKYIGEYGLERVFVSRVKDNMNAPKYKIMTDEDVITPQSKITFVRVSKDVGLYYRDLFAHRLGNTKAEIYMLMLIDGKVAMTFGLHSANLRMLKTEDIFEVFGFSVSLQKYPTINRLLMLAITCEEFKQLILKGGLLGVKNQLFTLKGLKTTCISKYRKVRLNNGILQIIKREKMKNGNYKIVYRTDFYKGRTFADCIRIFLDENNKKETERGAEDE